MELLQQGLEQTPTSGSLSLSHTYGTGSLAIALAAHGSQGPTKVGGVLYLGKLLISLLFVPLWVDCTYFLRVLGGCVFDCPSSRDVLWFAFCDVLG